MNARRIERGSDGGEVGPGVIVERVGDHGSSGDDRAGPPGPAVEHTEQGWSRLRRWQSTYIPVLTGSGVRAQRLVVADAVGRRAYGV